MSASRTPSSSTTPVQAANSVTETAQAEVQDLVKQDGAFLDVRVQVAELTGS